jgi:ribA/ribD-fused uncharacterized protein
MNVNDFLRNDHSVKIIVAGMEYPSVEHAFQAAKTDDVDVKKQIANSSAREAKSIGRTVVIPLSWDERRLAVMEALIRQKFFSDDTLRDKLVETGEEVLEMVRRGDGFWGVDQDGVGENNLGKILMKVRAEAQYIYGWIPVEKDDDEDESDEEIGTISGVLDRVEALVEFLEPPSKISTWSILTSIDDISVDDANKLDTLVRNLVRSYRSLRNNTQGSDES